MTFNLCDLPPEIFDLVLASLVPVLPEIGETRPVSYDKMIPEEPWYDYFQRRHTLHALCRTSSAIAQRARRYLYHTVSIFTPEALTLFFRTLVERPWLGVWTKRFSCHLTLTDSFVLMGLRRAVKEHVVMTLWHPSLADLLSVPLHGPSDLVAQWMVFTILRLLPNLNILLLQLPICDDHGEYEDLISFFSRDIQVGDKSSYPFLERPFQNITTLLLQGDPDLYMLEAAMPEPAGWGCQARRYVPIFDALPALHTLEVTVDDGMWKNLGAGASPENPSAAPYLHHFKHLYLHASAACPRNLHHVLINSPNVETLYMTPRRAALPPYHPNAGLAFPVHPKALDHALRRRAHTLRHLDLGWFNCRGAEGLIGKAGCLHSLSQLEHLETLCLQLNMLYTTPQDMHNARLANLIPRSIVVLTLEDWWWKDEDEFEHLSQEYAVWNSHRSPIPVLPDHHPKVVVLDAPNSRMYWHTAMRPYCHTILCMLSEFADDLTRFPKLRTISFGIQMSLYWYHPDDWGNLMVYFKLIVERFQQRGVKFNVYER